MGGGKEMTNTQECPCDCGGMCVLNADLDAAEAKVEQLKQALHKELIQLANRIEKLENVLIQILSLAEPDGFESEELKCIYEMATKAIAEAITEDSSVDHLRDATKIIEEGK
jgi:hypothetical protein